MMLDLVAYRLLVESGPVDRTHHAESIAIGLQIDGNGSGEDQRTVMVGLVIVPVE